MARLVGLVAISAALAVGTVTDSVAAPAPVDLPRQSLAEAIPRLARQLNVELIADPVLIAGLAAPAVKGQVTLDEALRQLLSQTDLTFRHLPGDVVLIERKPEAQPATAVSEILVTGRRSLNVGIPRSRDDIQPYRVITGGALRQLAPRSIDEFFKASVASNAQTLLSSQAPVANNGGVRSQIDLRGLGTKQTLVLVDGHRLPYYPALDAFEQSNIGGIPMGAIERIEILSSTAGAIYGPGALGGAVNLVLKHQARGVDLSVTRGLTQEGGAASLNVDGHVGWTSGNDATKLDLVVSHAYDGGLSVGDRDYVQSARLARYRNSRNYFAFAPVPVSDVINIRTLSGAPLSLKGAASGTTLGSSMTSIPLSVIGTAGQAPRLANAAGGVDFSLPHNGEGLDQSLLSKTRRAGATLTMRHRFSDSLEGFFDVFMFREEGVATGPLDHQEGDGEGRLNASDPSNPFQQTVLFSYPALPVSGRYRTTNALRQATGGLIFTLPKGWRGELDATAGVSTLKSGFPVRKAIPVTPNPFDTSVFPVHLAKLGSHPYAEQRSSHVLYDMSVRISGPVAKLPAGAVTATLSGEVRRDYNPGVHYRVSDAAFRSKLPPNSPSQRLAAQSLYAEVRAPFVSPTAAFAPLRGLEVQLAIRGDLNQVTVPAGRFTLLEATNNMTDGEVSDVRQHEALAAFTAGAKVQPTASLMFRTSYAAAAQPVDPAYLVSRVVEDAFGPGNTFAGFSSIQSGSAKASPVRDRLSSLP